MRRQLWLASLFVCFLVLLSRCSKDTSSTDIQESAQQVGDVMASMDESGGSNGSLALYGHRRTLARLAPEELNPSFFSGLFLPEAYADACSSASTFSSCSNNVITRTFGGCTVGSATFSGTVTLTYSDAAVNAICSLASSGHTLTRVPNFTVTGRRGATLTVSKTSSIGQRITKGSGSTFTFSNDGIRRVFTTAGGSTLFDFTTTTTSDITITGVSRSGRTVSGGSLRITNNLTGTTCDVSPSVVTWGASCNCPTSGSWSGSCSDGKAFSLTLGGCGSATLTLGSESETLTLDRCYSI